VLAATAFELDQGNLSDLAVNPSGTSFITASGAPYNFEEFRMSDLALDGVVYPAQPYPTAIASTSAGGGLVAGGINGIYSDDLFVYRLGDPSQTLFTYDFGGTSNTALARGLAFSPDGSRLFAISGDSYYGNTAFNVVQLSTKASTTTTLQAAHNPPQNPKRVTFTATVKSGSTGTPGGSVSFYDGSRLIGTSPLGPGGTASLTTTRLTKGTHSVTAAYSGDASFTASTSTPVTVAVR
jgi:hypothetical protein